MATSPSGFEGMGRARTGSAEEDVVAQKGVSLPCDLDDERSPSDSALERRWGSISQTIALRSSRRSPSSGEAMLRSAVAAVGWSMARTSRSLPRSRSQWTYSYGWKAGWRASNRAAPLSVGGRPSASRRRAAATPADPVNCRRPNSAVASRLLTRLPVAARKERTSRWPCRQTSSTIRRSADPDHSEQSRWATSGLSW